jgi:phage terminase large subunit
VADIADWYPQYTNKESPFYYGTNAVECISYLAKPTKKMKPIEFLDKVMEKIYEDVKSYPYNAEDVCCDFIRWVENYVRPGADYDHLDYDQVWSSCKIKDHPFGRQKAMLDLGLVKTFNGMKAHPSDDAIIKQAGLTVEQYKELCKTI